MKTTALVDKTELYYILSKLISNNPIKQAEWVKSILTNPFSKQFNRNIEGLTYLDQYETHLSKAGLFMLVRVFESIETKEKEIAKVEFFEDVKAIENYFLEIYDVEDFTYKQYRLFYYDKDDGYIEIPYSLGEYKIFEGNWYHDLEKSMLVPKPEATYYEGSIDDYCKDRQTIKSFFLEIPNLYEFELGYIEDDEQGIDSGVATKQYYFFKSFDRALDHAVKEILHYSTYDRVILSNRWYSYYLYIDTEDREEPKDGFNNISWPNALDRRIIVEVTLKFNE
ncbi:hypothetical protein [Sinanaerobacter sp. ZZT-01]|uniref:hypothetical protein n=1 Tax=Sinanaerobacter sp. ZZT-01 TaxID=3111540 RepID=UPI002D7956EA|nr:hypothetical protein [Sinanaerobacter sp. ZZT-01]WRR92741.1 hypothetical protein U5921_11890 [Sinanaerobacter sp. ZZT-01]